ncbi:MAG TPA: SUMF1/EgtB/PvdO family nonheme iron enzyme [Candidatus Competibacter sp.]|nr:SUMF1/EgtB/PvdO family nonheme iron enzyme [Candidatus Competibacter sp.]
MAENRSALIVAVSEYQDAGLRRLVAPPQDAEALARVLGDMTIGGFAVKTLLNQPSHQVNREIEAFFASGAKDDLLLLYFSGHGLKDEMGRLYFATTDTDRRLLRSTAVSAALLHDLMNDCSSRRQVLLLDCCYSGAFARGKTHHKAGQTVDIGEYFGQGRGQFILTASDAMQYAFEGDAISGEGLRSVFTDTLVQGLGTGEADLDSDGAVSCDELYRYLCERIADRMPQQKPRKWAFAAEGDIIIARNPRPIIKLVALPAELQQSIEDPRPWVREGAARHLVDLLQNGNKGLAAAAQAALQQMAEDDSLKVRTVVAEILKARAEEKPLVTEQKEPVTTLPEKAKAQPNPPTILSGESTTLALPAIQNIHGWSTQQVQTLQQQTAQAFGLAVEFSDRLKDGSQGPMMVVVPGGRFLMGSPEDEPGRSDDERQHEVEVKPFAIGKYAVTFEEYDRFAEVTGREKPLDFDWGRGRRPVINVTWFDAVAYAEWLSQQTGQTYRLLTEAEWEYACRAGTTTAYHFGASIQVKLANCRNKIKVVSDGGFFRKLFVGDQFIEEGENRTVKVGQYPANAWGLHDMHGNVWEWIGSEYDEGYGGAESRTVGDPNSDVRRVVRGGGWGDRPGYVRSAFRLRFAPDEAGSLLGFRLARAL